MGQWDLSLPKTNIHVSKKELLVYSANQEEVIARHKLSNIRRVTVQKRFEPICILFGIVGICLSYFPAFYVESTVGRWGLVGLGVVCVILAVLGAFGVRLVIETSSGELCYTINDLEEHAQGFAVTLTEILENLDRNQEDEDSQEFQASAVTHPEQELPV